MLKIFTSLPIRLLFCIILAFIAGSYSNPFVVALFYTVSANIIELLMFVLPFMIFAFIFNAINKIEHNSIFLVLLIFLGISISNFFSLSLTYFISQSVLPVLGLHHAPELTTKLASTVNPFFRLNLPELLGPGKAMIGAICLGIGLNFLQEGNAIKTGVQKGIFYLTQAVTLFLKKIFTPLLPLYVFGFCLKLSYDDALSSLFQSYGKVFILSMAIIWVYIPLLYTIAAGGDFKAALRHMKKMIPAGLTGFSTMSSAATMPVTLKCTQENLKDKNFTNLIIPTTANTHLLGDNITLTISSMALLTFFGMSQPDIWKFISFALVYCGTALSCAGVPGGTVLILLPVFQDYLNFTPEMLSAITTLYVLQDPFGTTSNVFANGGFALLMRRLVGSKIDLGNYNPEEKVIVNILD